MAKASFTSPLAPNALADGSAIGTTASVRYVPIGFSVVSLAAWRNWKAPTAASAPAAIHTMRAVWRFRTGRSSGSSSSSPVG